MTRGGAIGRIVRATGTRPKVVTMFMLAEWSFLDVMWSMFIFFAWMIWIYLLFLVLADNFRRPDHSGWAKAMWTIFVIFLPLLGVLVYMIARPKEDVMLA
jgi:hypothetical protein